MAPQAGSAAADMPSAQRLSQIIESRNEGYNQGILINEEKNLVYFSISIMDRVSLHFSRYDIKAFRKWAR